MDTLNSQSNNLNRDIHQTNIKTLSADMSLFPTNPPLRLKSLQEQVIVITGASSGIGLATARMAAAKGANIVAAARNEDALQQLTDELQQKGTNAVYVKADVGLEEDVIKIAKTAIQTFGRFDTWVNNAGITIYGHAMDVTIEDMKKMFATTIWGVVYGSRVAVKHFKEQGSPGALINVGSLFDDRGTVLQSTYAAAKFAVHGWTENIRMELDKEKAPISVTLIHPGRNDTPYNEHGKSYLNLQPAHRGMLYPPQAVAEAILHAAEYPKRDMYVGSQAKLVQLLGTLFPRTADYLMKIIMYPTQHANRPSKPQEENALYEAGYGLKERGTNIGWKRKGSMYVKMSKNPIMSIVALGSVGFAVWAMTRKKK